MCCLNDISATRKDAFPVPLPVLVRVAVSLAHAELIVHPIARSRKVYHEFWRLVIIRCLESDDN